MATKVKDVTTYKDAFSRLADGLAGERKFKTGSFWEFVRDIWSQGYDHPE